MEKTIQITSLRIVKDGELKYEYDEKINTPSVVPDIFKKFIGDRDREYSVVLCLDIKNNINSISIVSIGSLNSAIIHPREIYKIAIMSNAAAIILAHNHPSGDTTPSQEDKNITNRLIEAGKILGIELLDHIIVSDNTYFSFRENFLI